MAWILTHGEIPDNHIRTFELTRGLQEDPSPTGIEDAETAAVRFGVADLVSSTPIERLYLVREKGLALSGIVQDLQQGLAAKRRVYYQDPSFWDFEYRPYSEVDGLPKPALMRSCAERSNETIPFDLLTIQFGKTALVTESRWPLDLPPWPSRLHQVDTIPTTHKFGEIQRLRYEVPITPEQQAQIDAVPVVDDQLLAAAQFEQAEQDEARRQLELARIYNTLG